MFHHQYRGQRAIGGGQESCLSSVGGSEGAVRRAGRDLQSSGVYSVLQGLALNLLGFQFLHCWWPESLLMSTVLLSEVISWPLNGGRTDTGPAGGLTGRYNYPSEVSGAVCGALGHIMVLSPTAGNKSGVLLGRKRPGWVSGPFRSGVCLEAQRQKFSYFLTSLLLSVGSL